MSELATKGSLLQELARELAAGEAIKSVTIRKDITVDGAINDPNVNKIILPGAMTKLRGAEELMRMHKDEENEMDFNRVYGGWYWKDTLVAIKKVSEEAFGWIQGRTIYSFFGNQKPAFISVVTNIVDGREITEECFYGKFLVSSWEDASCIVSIQGGYASVTINAKKKYAKQIKIFLDAIADYVKANSIYRGKAVVVTLDKDKNLDFQITELKPNPRIILNESEERIMKHFVLATLEDKGKRCYLFTGNYGTGKTETAIRIGAESLTQGLTFFYCKDTSKFTDILDLTKQYQPAILFCEDVDSVAGGEQRDTHMNDILNTLDGVQTKGNDIIVIFTTNHEKRINPALRRPGRIDLIVQFRFPEKTAVAKIYEVYLKDLKGGDKIDYTAAAEATPEVSGAVIAEIAKRAVIMYKRQGSIDTESLLACVDSMAHQIALMNEDMEKIVTPAQALANSFNSILAMPEVLTRLEDIQASIG